MYSGQISQLTIYDAVPRFLTFDLEDRVIDIKTKIYNHIIHIFSNKDNAFEDENAKNKWINDNILL
jgi:hypothetical protein